MQPLRFSDSILIERPAEFVYDMVADISRMGEWSPVCSTCWWDEGDGPRAAAWFTGRNETPERTWETRSQVVLAERGRGFAFVVNGTLIRWSYAFRSVPGGTEVSESWAFLPAGIAYFNERYGADAATQIADRTEAARQGIPETLAALKQVAESSPS